MARSIFTWPSQLAQSSSNNNALDHTAEGNFLIDKCCHNNNNICVFATTPRNNRSYSFLNFLFLLLFFSLLLLLLFQHIAVLQHFHVRFSVYSSLFPFFRSYTPSCRARGFFRPPPSRAPPRAHADETPPTPAVSTPSRPAGHAARAARAAPRSPRGPIPAVPASRTNSPRSTMKLPR